MGSTEFNFHVMLDFGGIHTIGGDVTYCRLLMRRANTLADLTAEELQGVVADSEFYAFNASPDILDVLDEFGVSDEYDESDSNKHMANSLRDKVESIFGDAVFIVISDDELVHRASEALMKLQPQVDQNVHVIVVSDQYTPETRSSHLTSMTLESMLALIERG